MGGDEVFIFWDSSLGGWEGQGFCFLYFFIIIVIIIVFKGKEM